MGGERPSPLFAPLSSLRLDPPTAAVSDGLCKRARRPNCGFRPGSEQPLARPSDRPPGTRPSFSPLQGPLPETNQTAARSCDGTAVSADWLPPGVSTSFPSLSASTPTPKLQANETALYRLPPSAFFFPLPSGRRSSDWPDVLGSPLPLTNTEKGTLPAEFSSQLRSSPGILPCIFTRNSRFPLFLTLHAFF